MSELRSLLPRSRACLMEESEIHLVKASFLEQFRTAMESCGGEPDRYFRQCRLPTRVDDPESLLPLKPFFRLINQFAIDENIPNFGAIVAQTTPWHKVASLAPLIVDSDNLEALLLRFCEVSVGQSSPVTFGLERDDGEIRFWYRSTLRIQGDVQMEFYRLSCMIQLVQLATGADWRPKSIELQMPETRLISTCPLLADSAARFDRPVTSVAIEPALLKLPVHVDIPASVPAAANRLAHEHTAFGESLRQIIDSYTPTGGITIEDLANITDQSVRTLQRRLRAAGLNFSRMVAEARYDSARDRLINSHLKVEEIGRQLGYTDPAHFTRAFRRWSGMTPSRYRKLNRPG